MSLVLPDHFGISMKCTNIVPFMNLDPHFARKTKRAATKNTQITQRDFLISRVSNNSADNSHCRHRNNEDEGKKM